MTNSKGAINNKTLDNLNIFYTNARSVRNKWNEFISYFYSEDIDIACITETWISETYFGDNLGSFNIIGYNYKKKDSVAHRRFVMSIYEREVTWADLRRSKVLCRGQGVVTEKISFRTSLFQQNEPEAQACFMLLTQKHCCHHSGRLYNGMLF